MKSRTNAALLLLGTFLLGVVSGAISFSLYRTHVNASGRMKNSQPSGPHKIVEELARGLDMDSAQKEKLAVIINQSRDRYRALSKQFRPQYDTIRDQTRQEIRQILHENQKPRFEELIQEMDSRHKGSGRRPPNNKP
jgi:uncharacterized membrane protein